MKILRLNGTDKKLYALVAPLVMNPAVIRQNNNYPYKTSSKYMWHLMVEKDKVTGFVNDINGNDLVIYYKKDEMVMTFGFQNAHFTIDDVESLIIHTEKS